MPVISANEHKKYSIHFLALLRANVESIKSVQGHTRTQLRSQLQMMNIYEGDIKSCDKTTEHWTAASLLFWACTVLRVLRHMSQCDHSGHTNRSYRSQAPAVSCPKVCWCTAFILLQPCGSSWRFAVTRNRVTNTGKQLRKQLTDKQWISTIFLRICATSVISARTFGVVWQCENQDVHERVQWTRGPS